jgi:hypothetical protein
VWTQGIDSTTQFGFTCRFNGLAEAFGFDVECPGRLGFTQFQVKFSLVAKQFSQLNGLIDSP